jgi:hypothetical protein
MAMRTIQSRRLLVRLLIKKFALIHEGQVSGIRF